MNLTGSAFVTGPVPKNSFAPTSGPDAIYSGLARPIMVFCCCPVWPPFRPTFRTGKASLWAAFFGFLAALFGLLFGPLIDRSGSRNLLLIGLVTLGCLHVSAGLLTELWARAWFQLLVFVGDQFVGQIVFICFIALHMNVCWEKVAATQFAIYMAWSNLARSIGAGIYGEVQPMLVMGQEFLIMGVSALIAAAVLSLVNFKGHELHLAELRAMSQVV